MSDETPTPALVRIVNYIVFVYGPVFLAIKHKNRVQQAPYHLVQEISLVREHCTEEEKMVVHKAIQDNGFMAHHESVLLALLGSTDQEDRKFAVEMILQIRDLGEQMWPVKSHGIRPVKVGYGLKDVSCIIINFRASNTIKPFSLINQNKLLIY